MEHQQHHRTPPGNEAPERRPIEKLHPALLYLITRMGVMPPGNPAALSEAALTEAVSLAIALAPDEEQAYIVSRIMTDEEIALQRLQSPEVRDLQRRITISGQERRLVLRASPEREEEEDEKDDDGDDGYEGEENENEDPCLVCAGRSAVAVPCGCRYCLPCLRACIRTGLRSEVDFPPRCCRALDEATVRLAGRPGLVHLFRQMAAEFTVPAARRVHCHDARCGAFIPPGIGACPVCGWETCAACGGRAHRGLPYREETDEEAMYDMMDRQGLVHCPECGVVMALGSGCNHMTCFCGAEFCFLCGRRWHSCGCPLFDHADRRVPVRQRPGRRPIARAGREHLAQNMEDEVRLPQLRYDDADVATLSLMGDDVLPTVEAPIAEGPEWEEDWEDPPEDDHRRRPSAAAAARPQDAPVMEILRQRRVHFNEPPEQEQDQDPADDFYDAEMPVARQPRLRDDDDAVRENLRRWRADVVEEQRREVERLQRMVQQRLGDERRQAEEFAWREREERRRVRQENERRREEARWARVVMRNLAWRY